MGALPVIRFLDSRNKELDKIPPEFISALTRDGWEIHEAVAGEFAMLWARWSEARFYSQAIQERGFKLEFVDEKLDLKLKLVMDWDSASLGGDRRIWLSATTFQTAYFWRSADESDRYSSRLIDVAIQLYNIVRPSFGWIDFNHGLITNHEDIDQGRLPALYWVNMFGPGLVKRLGNEWIKKAPGWKTISLSDGGLLYALSPGIGLTSQHLDTNRVKSYFNIERVR
jgi:hypothetical protein